MQVSLCFIVLFSWRTCSLNIHSPCKDNTLEASCCHPGKQQVTTAWDCVLCQPKESIVARVGSDQVDYWVRTTVNSFRSCVCLQPRDLKWKTLHMGLGVKDCSLNFLEFICLLGVVVCIWACVHVCMCSCSMREDWENAFPSRRDYT